MSDKGKLFLALLGLCVVLVIIFPNSGEQRTAAPFDASIVQRCNDLISQAQSEGLIRSRPSADRIDVDELQWAQLPADSKKGIAMAVRCSAYNGAAGQLDGAEVYGFHTGHRLALATSVGTTLD